MSTVDTIKERLSITEVIGTYLKLEKAGANLKGLCPFHHEKSPSFFVSPARNSFYCFGCGAKGDIFSFVEQFEGVDFMGALKILADRAGVEIVKENPKAKSEKDRLYKAIEYAAFFYHKELSGNDLARGYLTKRGVTVQTMKDWQLGYAPSEWRALYTYLSAKGFTSDELIKAGLIKKAETSYYDVFRSRIMFPIADSSGRIVAFSGRIFPEEKDIAKYLNTPETPLFNKSAILYGYDKAKLNIRKAEKAILVEGQMDLILSHQVGINTVIATSGTAFTEQHAQAIKRFANTLVICFDGDTAGINASLRAASIALAQGLEVKVAFLPDGKDPADLAVQDKALYEDCLKKAEHVVEFALRMVLKKAQDDREKGKLIITEVLPYVKSMTSTVEQSHFIRIIAGKAGIREEALWEDFKKAQSAFQGVEQKPARSATNTARTLESQLFGISYLLEANMLQLPNMDATVLQKRIADIVGEPQFEALKKEHEPNKQELLLYAEVSYDSPERLSKDIEEFCYRLEEETIKQQYTRAMQELSQAEISKDQEKIRALLEHCKTLSHRLSIIHKNKK